MYPGMMIHHFNLDEFITNLTFNLINIVKHLHECSHKVVDYHIFSSGEVWIVILQSFIFVGSGKVSQPPPLGLDDSYDLVSEIHLTSICYCCSIYFLTFFLF